MDIDLDIDTQYAAFQPIFARMLAAGWVIRLTSCRCGGSWAWLKPHPSGAEEMYGCLCHRTPSAMLEFLETERGDPKSCSD